MSESGEQQLPRDAALAASHGGQSREQPQAASRDLFCIVVAKETATVQQRVALAFQVEAVLGPFADREAAVADLNAAQPGRLFGVKRLVAPAAPPSTAVPADIEETSNE